MLLFLLLVSDHMFLLTSSNILSFLLSLALEVIRLEYSVMTFCDKLLTKCLHRVENRSFFFPVHFRQVDGANDSWKFLAPNAAASFFWEDLGRQRLLEVIIDGSDPAASLTYNIDEISDHQPIHGSGGPKKALHVIIQKEEKVNVVKISDWMPENATYPILNRNPSLLPSSGTSSISEQTLSNSESEFHVIVEVAELGLSVIDHTPEEILYLSVQSLVLSYSTGLGSGVSR